MRIKAFLLFLVFLILSSCKSEAEKIADQTAIRNAKMDSILQSFEVNFLKEKIDSVIAKYDFNGAVSISKNNAVIYERFNGFENFRTKKKIDSSSVFAIASITKQFTAVLILEQEEKGTLSTNDSVSKYFKTFQTKPFKNITIKQLLNHTSGLSDFGNGLLSKPGEKFNYSNKGYCFLGQILEKISETSYDENAKDLFLKVGMTNSTTANLSEGHHFSSAYLGNSKKFQEIPKMPKRLAAKEISVPAGGILSTVSDLHLWNSKLYKGEILNQKSLQKITEKSSDRNHPILGKMGYGFGVMMSKKEPLCYFHSGYVRGAPSLLIYYPETKTSVVILSNIADETKGKNVIFNPHKAIKEITDSLQTAAPALRKKLLEMPIEK